MRVCREFWARLAGRGFVCNALQGSSEYNISINCDMTVSCNCQDDGPGILGSLNEKSFEEIFFGPKANFFRALLAGGKLPILTCARCSELRIVGKHTPEKALEEDSLAAKELIDRKRDAEEENGCGECRSSASARGAMCENGKIKTDSYFSALMHSRAVFCSFVFIRVHSWLKKYSVPNYSAISPPHLPFRGMLVENTIACNLACPGCIRPDVEKIRKKTRMSLDDVRKVAELIQRLKLQKLFYFNRGEPFLSPDILEEMKIIRASNPDVHIVTSTNGMFLDTDAKRESALLMDEVVFSIDGCDQRSLQKYQRGGDFEQMLNNFRALVQFRDECGLKVPQIEWKYLLFNWNDRPRQIVSAIAAASGREAVDKLLNGGCSGSGRWLNNPTTHQPINPSTESALPSADLISFWPTNNPAYGISWRYRLGFLNRIGTKSWKGREVRLDRDFSLKMKMEPLI